MCGARDQRRASVGGMLHSRSPAPFGFHDGVSIAGEVGGVNTLIDVDSFGIVKVSTHNNRRAVVVS